MSEENPFTQIEVVEFEGMTWASVYDLIQWIKEMGLNGDYTDSERAFLASLISQLTRLVTK